MKRSISSILLLLALLFTTLLQAPATFAEEREADNQGWLVDDFGDFDDDDFVDEPFWEEEGERSQERGQQDIGIMVGTCSSGSSWWYDKNLSPSWTNSQVFYTVTACKINGSSSHTYLIGKGSATSKNGWWLKRWNVNLYRPTNLSTPRMYSFTPGSRLQNYSQNQTVTLSLSWNGIGAGVTFAFKADRIDPSWDGQRRFNLDWRGNHRNEATELAFVTRWNDATPSSRVRFHVCTWAARAMYDSNHTQSCSGYRSM
jgi:hypothetical protein